jgi:hypothetical protein
MTFSSLVVVVVTVEAVVSLVIVLVGIVASDMLNGIDVILVVSIEIGVVSKVLVADDYRKKKRFHMYAKYYFKFTVIMVVVMDEEMTVIVELIEVVVENSVVSCVVTA